MRKPICHVVDNCTKFTVDYADGNSATHSGEKMVLEVEGQTVRAFSKRPGVPMNEIIVNGSPVKRVFVECADDWHYEVRV